MIDFIEKRKEHFKKSFGFIGDIHNMHMNCFSCQNANVKLKQCRYGADITKKSYCNRYEKLVVLCAWCGESINTPGNQVIDGYATDENGKKVDVREEAHTGCYNAFIKNNREWFNYRKEKRGEIGIEVKDNEKPETI